MYRPSLYDKHDETMNYFAELFNSCETCPNLKMYPITEETFIDDGEFVDENTGNSFSFDWEYRDKYFSNGIFDFDTLGQFERKIVKPSIQLSIQCDSTNTAIAVAWHEDFRRENRITRSLDTDYNDKQLGNVRYTHAFKIYLYTDISEFKEMIQRAFDGEFNSSVF
jgi:hypothetical protein